MATPGISSEKLVQSIDPSPPALGPAPSAVGKKKLSRRLSVDRSQLFRRIVQFAFLALNLWIGLEFYAWVRFFESGGVTKYVERPAGVDGWLPIDALMNMKLALLTGSVPRVHPAGMFLLLAFLAVSLLLHKAFCSWLCPVGTLSEYLWKLGRKLLRRNFQTPRWVDIPLRALKYLLLAFFVVLYASSTHNKSKMDQEAQSLVQAFHARGIAVFLGHVLPSRPVAKSVGALGELSLGHESRQLRVCADWRGDRLDCRLCGGEKCLDFNDIWSVDSGRSQMVGGLRTFGQAQADTGLL